MEIKEKIKHIVNEIMSNENDLNEYGEDFGVNVKGDLTIDDIKQGEKVYHRPKDSNDSNPLSVINSLMKNGFSREYTGSNGGNMYGPGVYNVYSLHSSNDKATGYGRYIVQSYVLGGYKDFLIFNIDIAKKVYGENWPIVNQIKMLIPSNIAQKVLNSVHELNKCMNTNKTSYDIKTSIPAKKIVDILGRDIAKTKIRGIIYSGGHDGNCCFVRNFSDVVPYSYSKDNGKTWTVGITEELIWRAGHNTDVDAILKNRVDDKGNKMFSDTAERSINGFVRVYQGNKMNYFEVATNKLISDVWFDFGEEFDENETTKVVYNGKKYEIAKNDEDGRFIVYDEFECPVCYLEDLPNVNEENPEIQESSMKINENDIKYMIFEVVNNLLEGQSLIDNFDMAANIMDINSPDDFHFVQIIKRFKDNPYDDRRVGNYHSGAWYLGGYRVHSTQELMALKPQIIAACEKNNARAYMTINNRSDKETDSYIKVYRRNFNPTDARFIHADQIIPGQAKDGPNWKGMRKRLIIDIDVPNTEKTRDGKNVWDEVRKILKVAGIVPIAEYITPSGGLHIILPDKEDEKFLTIKDLFRKFDNWKDKGKLAMVHPNVDAKIILYSNVKTKGY